MQLDEHQGNAPCTPAWKAGVCLSTPMLGDWYRVKDLHPQPPRSERGASAGWANAAKKWGATVMLRALRFKRPLHHFNACDPKM